MNLEDVTSAYYCFVCLMVLPSFSLYKSWDSCYLEGKRGIKNLAHRMVKSCVRLSMPGKTDFPFPNGSSNSGVHVSVRENTESGQPNGIIVTVAASLWLPLAAQDVFGFFTDQRTSTQWDTLSNEITRRPYR